MLSRTPRPEPWRVVGWDGVTPGDWHREIDGSDVVINMAGRSVNCRYSPANRAEIMNSRIDSTRIVGHAIAQSRKPPRLRGGVFDTLRGLVRRGLGGPAGDGRQYVSWIHYLDFLAAVRWLIDHDRIDGIVNMASPNPVPNAEFMRTLREACGGRVGLAATKWMLELGAIFLRTETELILKSRKVVPGKLMEQGFQFRFPMWRNAATDLCRGQKLAPVSERVTA